MGLVARALEAAGLSTVTLSMIPELTCAVGAPRVAAINYPLGLPLGLPHDTEGQRAVLAATLSVLEQAAAPGATCYLPFEWREPRWRKLTAPRQLPPIAKLIMRRPWLFIKLLSGEIPD